jgi:hypothetical protein
MRRRFRRHLLSSPLAALSCAACPPSDFACFHMLICDEVIIFAMPPAAMPLKMLSPMPPPPLFAAATPAPASAPADITPFCRR